MKIENSYTKSIDDVLIETESSMQGLSLSAAKERLQKDGKNEITHKKKKSEFVKFLEQFKDILIIVLIVSCVLSIVLGILNFEESGFTEFIDAGIILSVVLINAIIGYVQERKSEMAMEALKNMTKPFCKVIRNGRVSKIKSEELVIGDVVVLEAGDIIPADLRFIEAESLMIEESSLTGESEAVEKDIEIIENPNVVLAERKNMGFMGSVVTNGRGYGVVIATAMDTEIGKIAQALSEIQSQDTPLTKRIQKTSKILTLIVLVAATIIFIISAIKSGVEGLLNSFTTAIAIAVCVVPEGLPACITITMSSGVKKMSEQRAIVKKLPAVETLGSTEIICTDKTGTLTINKMTVKQAYFLDESLKDFNKLNFGSSYTSKAKMSQEDVEKTALDIIENSKVVQECMKCMLLCNDVQVKLEDNALVCIGDPTEIALAYCGYYFGASKESYGGKYTRVGEVPFDSDRKMMSTINKVDDKFAVYTKGAVDSILERCTKIYDNGRIRNIKKEDIEAIEENNSNMALGALRVLAFAFKMIDENIKKPKSNNTENDLVFLGLVGMIDPPREEVYEAIKTCKSAGITPIMITGDHKDTAFAIAKELGICKDKSRVMTGEQISKMPDDKFAEAVLRYQVYARVSPEHKVRIVQALKAHDKVVAMTGDGVNDAPSIKSADIGIGMGITGTDVTKEAADVILTDDNFATIVGAVKEGRRIYQNILKILAFLIGTGFAELVSIAVITCILGDVNFMGAVLLLFFNFVSDTFTGLALGFEKPSKNIMKEQPHRVSGNLFKGKVGFNILMATLYVSTIMIGLYSILTYVFKMSSEAVTTTCFIFLCFAEFFHAFNLKDDTQSLFSKNPFDNNVLNWGFMGSAIVTIIVLLLPIPALQAVLGTTNISYVLWLIAIGLAFLMIPFWEIIKAFARAKERKRRLVKNEE